MVNWQIKPIIDDSFLTELVTGIMSSPIILIPHYHFSYVDEALHLILQNDDSSLCGIHVSENDVMELSELRGIIDFSTKKKTRDDNSVKSILRDLFDGEEGINTDKKKIFLCKGNLTELLKDNECVAELEMYASIYERGYFENTTTFVFVDDVPLSLLPSSIVPYIQVVNVPLPTDNVIRQLLSGIPVSKSISNESQDMFRQSLVRIFQGLHQQQIISILRSVLVRTGGVLSHVAKDLAEEEKKNLLRKSDMVEVVDSDVTLDQIGGLETLKEDIRMKACIFKNLHKATSPSVNIPYPKGILILGMPGCGKSMIAKGIANEFGMPLLRLDINRMMGKYVGESEENLRKSLQIAEAAHPCVLWIDEVEKAFSGSSGGDSEGDSIVVRLMGYFLTWMQEKKHPVYVVATANDAMRPEFMRKGRFDEVYFVNFPNKKETEDILKKKIKRYTGSNSIFSFTSLNDRDYCKLSEEMQGGTYGGFAGSEIEAVVSAVVEKEFIHYIEMSSNVKVSVSVQVFLDVIKRMKSSIMANQKGTNNKKTNIERILETQKCFNLKSATK